MKKWLPQKLKKILPKSESEIKIINERQKNILDQPNDLARLIKSYKSEKEPGYALLITGDWGSGKTHQITKKFLLPESYYYISLFGLKAAEEIHAHVFSAMHPFKSSLKNKANSLSESGIEVYGVSVSLGNIAPQLISSFVKNNIKKDRIIIFDDFERCDVPINERLGAINSYVEHENCQVIVISNDDKIVYKEFSEAKEKVFGTTFRITSDSSEVFDYFLEKFKEEKSIDSIKKIKNEILGTLDAGRINSLRVLKQVISDVFKLYACLEDYHLENEDVLLKLTKFFTAVSAEVRIGNFKKDELLNRTSHIARFLSAGNDPLKTNDTEKKFNAAQEKYKEINIRLDDAILSDEVLVRALISGIFDNARIIESINRSEFYHSKSTVPNWRIMMKFDELDDSSTERITSNLINEFNNRVLTHPGDILHLMAFMLLMSKINVIETDIETTTSECLDYIKDVYNTKTLQPIDLDKSAHYRLRESYDGYAYYLPKENRNHFQEIYDFLIEKIKLANENSLSQESSNILELLTSNPQKFINLISYGNHNDGLFAEKPILKYIDVNVFFNAFLNTRREFWHAIKSSLEKRYDVNIRTSLNSEIDWVISLVDRFEEEIKNSDGINKLRLERATPNFIKEKAVFFRDNSPILSPPG